MCIGEDFIPVVCQEIRVRKEDFGLIVVSKRTPILTMNHDSENIWNCIDGFSNIKEICLRLNVGSEVNKGIVMEFISSCYKLGLIKFKNEDV